MTRKLCRVVHLAKIFMNSTLMTHAGSNTCVEHGDGLSSSLAIALSNSRTYPTPVFRLLQGDARKLITSMPQVHCIVTSPPFFRQRIHGDNPAEEIGQNKEVDGYIDDGWHRLRADCP